MPTGDVEAEHVTQDLLPAEIVTRRKSGMRVPVELWLQGKFNRFARERLLDGLAPSGIIRRSYLEELARPDKKLPPPRWGVKIWLLLSLEAWLRTGLGGFATVAVLLPPSAEGGPNTAVPRQASTMRLSSTFQSKMVTH